ncbi:dipeptidase [Undibacterium sp. Ji50W]|uniref:dipeptidase n=1 Tax=Undibacterium sp. Ji50W TaxID=3413041 RepID=UPI003BF1517C
MIALLGRKLKSSLHVNKLQCGHTKSRRSFLQCVAGSALYFSLPAPSFSIEQDVESSLHERATALLDSVLSVDIHSHAGGILGHNAIAQDISSPMKQGRLSAICLSLASDSILLSTNKKNKLFARREPKPGELHAYMVNRLDFVDRMIAQQGLQRVLTLADLQASKEKKSAGVILAVEGSDFLEGKIEHLQIAYKRGIRHWQLVHYRMDNALGDIQTEAPLYGGATPYGLDVVRECNRLGMVVDVAHATFATANQIANVSSTPLILSHTGYSAAPKFQSRWISADHAKLVADTGGVIGIWANAHSFSGFADYAVGIAKLADLIGIDHVAIGTDKEAMHPPIFSSYAEFPEFVGQLLLHFNKTEVGKIVGGNYLRVFDQVTRHGKAD